MISRLKGKIEEILENKIILNVNDISYEILVPDSVLQSLTKDDDALLITTHFYQTEANRMVPVLVGFRNEVEREFFEQLMKVSGIGVKVAIKVLKYPVSHVAIAIDRADEKFLSSLPGIGIQKARLIIAKLQGKVAKYALVQEGEKKNIVSFVGIEEEALEILLRLQYKKKEAEDMIQKALIRNPGAQEAEDILNEIYKVKISQNGDR
ncbi:MAG: Holliday junction branch migration protein RuvA [Candidatus Saelkia tenebricola]|nr:Holliday junction branch migration protein RuvA [Candidatus Saelkia tenebricola]